MNRFLLIAVVVVAVVVAIIYFTGSTAQTASQAGLDQPPPPKPDPVPTPEPAKPQEPPKTYYRGTLEAPGPAFTPERTADGYLVAPPTGSTTTATGGRTGPITRTPAPAIRG